MRGVGATLQSLAIAPLIRLGRCAPDPPSPTRGEGRAAPIALFLFALCAPAFAQESEIVVTAERRAQALDTLASNAAALSSDDLARVDAQAPSEALNRLPGVSIHRNNGVENLPAIRSPVLTGGQSSGSFLFLEDGAPIRAPGFANVNGIFETSMDFADRVEVVRGPGSALYGSNAVHGIVNVITPAPLAAPALDWSAELGSFGRESGTLSMAFGGETNRAYVGLHAEHTDGWRADSDLSRQQALFGWAARLGEWSLDGRIVFQNLNQQSAGFVQGPDVYDIGAIARSNPTPGAFRDQKLTRGRLTLERSFGQDWRLSLTGNARTIDSALQLFFFPSRAREESGQEGGGVQAALYWDPSETLSFIFGADSDVTQGRLREVQTLPTQPGGYVQGLHYDYVVDMRQIALYAQARWAFAPNWSATLGLRGEQMDYEYDNHAPDGDVGRFRRAADRSDDFDNVTPKLGFVWTPAEGQAIWLNLARGARAPQITDLYSLQTLQTPGTQRSETLNSVELGWRGALGPLRTEIALYHMDKDHTSFRASDGFTITDGASEHEGIELSGSLPLGDRFDLSGWVTYARHIYRFNNAADGVVDGNDIDTAPRWLWNARAHWRATDALGVELEWVHMGEYFTNAANTRLYPGHNVLNLRADWDVSERLTLYGAIRNLTNTDYADRADFAFGNDRYFPGEDRGFTIGVRARR